MIKINIHELLEKEAKPETKVLRHFQSWSIAYCCLFSGVGVFTFIIVKAYT